MCARTLKLGFDPGLICTKMSWHQLWAGIFQDLPHPAQLSLVHNHDSLEDQHPAIPSSKQLNCVPSPLLLLSQDLAAEWTQSHHITETFICACPEGHLSWQGCLLAESDISCCDMCLTVSIAPAASHCHAVSSGIHPARWRRDR